MEDINSLKVNNIEIKSGGSEKLLRGENKLSFDNHMTWFLTKKGIDKHFAQDRNFTGENKDGHY